MQSFFRKTSLRAAGCLIFLWRWALINSDVKNEHCQISVEWYLLTCLLTVSLEYHIGDLKNLTNSRSPAHVEDDNGS